MNDPLEILKTVQMAELPEMFEQRISEAIAEKRKQTIPFRKAAGIIAILGLVILSEVYIVVKAKAEKANKELSAMFPSGNDKLYE